ncbi:unnamed protein product [Symbiodinium sp. KB8]|nr:unnamed protein product [Symbiodinium sp. KB8]
MKEYLALREGAFWAKEHPDCRGGDLLGVFPDLDSDVPTVTIYRVQVKRATQDTLRSETQAKTADQRVREAVKNFMGVNFSEAKRDDLRHKHLPVVSAVADLIVAERMTAADPSIGYEFSQDWARAFREYHQKLDFKFVDGGPIIAMTHRPTARMAEVVWRRFGIRIIDGAAMRGHWALVQQACDALEILLEPYHEP